MSHATTTASDRRTDRPLVVVANRLPVHREDPTSQVWRTSPGGLVAALRPAVHGRHTQWIGWGGESDAIPERFDVDDLTLRPIALDRDEMDGHYVGFSNSSIWPLYHDAVFLPQFHRSWWDMHRRVNQRFADRVAEVAPTGAMVWVHDYQLQLVPEMVRALRPDVRIGFFLHIPFPPQELFLRLPWRSEIIRGILGSDVIGFQTRVGMSNFRQVARRLIGITSKGSLLEHENRLIRCDAFPVGIDVESIVEIAHSPSCDAEVAALRADFADQRRVLLGVDRLDYTKGISVRLRAYQELLEDGLIDPTEVVLVQIAQPTRADTPGYTEVRSEVEQLVGQINGDFASMTSVAVKYLHQSQSIQDLVALYRLADVMLVTPLRDGMNLVAKEFVAANEQGDGALVLSEFAGAAHQLRAAHLVNPYDFRSLKAGILDALSADRRSRARSLRTLAREVRTHDATWWADSFVDRLDGSTS